MRLKKQYSWDNCAKFDTLLSFDENSITWNSIMIDGEKYNITKDRIEKYITSYLTTLVDRLNDLFDLNFDTDTIRLFRGFRHCLDPNHIKNIRKRIICSYK